MIKTLRIYFIVLICLYVWIGYIIFTHPTINTHAGINALCVFGLIMLLIYYVIFIRLKQID